MHFELLGLYAGPDQVMGVTSGVAGLLGLLLIAWNKVVTVFFKIAKKFHRSAEPADLSAGKNAPTQTS